MSSEQTYQYTYPEEGSPIVKVTVGGTTFTSQSKNDHFGRKEFDELQVGQGFVSRQFSYVAGEVTEEHKQNGKLKSTPTTNLISQILLSGGRTISYEYDPEERITKVIDSVDGETVYTYDALGQLLTEKHKAVGAEEYTTVNAMTYDRYGNIKTKNGVEYVYDGVWRDKLIAYNGQTITYDAQGNPLSYRGHTLTWEKGRQLKSLDGITYTYNANGIRTSKTVNGVKHEYLLDGAKILRETWSGNTLVPLYDNEDSVCGIIYNGTPYYFQKNLQGDVIAIVDANADVVARYTYDAWGKITSTTGINLAIANINPFRYRSYYFDQETGLYYVSSRYYDPEIGRFLSSDAVEMLLVSIDAASANMYSYCENKPMNFIDLYGFKKISVTWIAPAVNLIIALIPAIWAINKLLRGGKAIVKTLIELGKQIISKGKKIIRQLDDWLYRQFSTTLGYELTKIIGSAIFSIIAVFLSVGSIVQYVVDCLDGKWDDYLDTKKKLKLRIILKRG